MGCSVCYADLAAPGTIVHDVDAGAERSAYAPAVEIVDGYDPGFVGNGIGQA